MGLFLTLFFCIGCTEQNKTEIPDIAISMATFQIPRWPQEASTITRLASAKGMTVVTQDANNDPQLQQAQLSEFIEQNIPIIIVVAVNGKALADQVRKAHQKGIRVIAYDRLVHSPHLTAYISFDNIEVGRRQALSILKVAPTGNYVLLGGSPTDNNAHLVRKGQLEELKPSIDQGLVRIVADPFIPNWEPHLAFLEMEKILKAHNNRIDAVVASNDGIALGAIQALILKGLVKKIPVSGQDATAEGCKAIIEGHLTVSVFKDIHQLAPLAYELAEKINRKEPLNLDLRPLKDLSLDEKSSGHVPCHFLGVSTIHRNNLYEKIILTRFHKWEEIYRDVPMDERPPMPR